MLLGRLLALAEQFFAAMFGVDEDVVGIAQPLLPGLANLAVAVPVVEFAVVQGVQQFGVDLRLQLLGKSSVIEVPFFSPEREIGGRSSQDPDCSRSHAPMPQAVRLPLPDLQ